MSFVKIYLVVSINKKHIFGVSETLYRLYGEALICGLTGPAHSYNRGGKADGLRLGYSSTTNQEDEFGWNSPKPRTSVQSVN